MVITILEKDYLYTDLAYSIPIIFREALESGRKDIVRGLASLSVIMWDVTNPGVRMLRMIVDSCKNKEKFLYDVAKKVLCSVRGYQLIEDFERWGLISYDSSNSWHIIPDFWEPFVMPDNPADFCLDIDQIGRLLGICSLAANDAAAVGLSSYCPVIIMLQRAIDYDGSLSRADIEDCFDRHGGKDSQAKVMGLLYESRDYRLIVAEKSMRYFISKDAMRVARLIRERTNNYYRGLSYG